MKHVFPKFTNPLRFRLINRKLRRRGDVVVKEGDKGDGGAGVSETVNSARCVRREDVEEEMERLDFEDIKGLL